MGRTSPPVAVVGMAARLPGASDVDSFWRNLMSGVESVRFFTRAELVAAGEPAEYATAPNYVPARAVIDDADAFDSAFFGITDGEAALTDPQLRLLLETAWRALEDAGHPPGPEARTGVFVGARNNEFARLVARHEPFTPGRAARARVKLGTDSNFLATQVSYRLNLRGPSMTLQTACSSALVAVHLATRALAAGDCDLALAGGVAVQVPLNRGCLSEDGLVESPDGHCRAFDADAAGTVGGDGVGLVALRLLEDALRDGDTIHAVIRGTASNNDGNDKLGFTAPSVRGQADLIRTGLANAGVDPAGIGYVECHGTGTRLGDPMELRAMHEVFGTGRDAPCWIGSVKSNIGHLDAAAGIAGLIKAVLTVRAGRIPPSLHVVRPNPIFDWEDTGLAVASQVVDWPLAGPRLAAVTSLGMGGTNAFAVIEEAPPLPARPAADGTAWHALPLSARSPVALARTQSALAETLAVSRDTDPADVAFTLGTGRRRFAHRSAVVCRTTAEAAMALAAGDVITAPEVKRVVFLAPGQGVAVRGSAAAAYRAVPVFAAAIDEVARLVRDHAGWDPRQPLRDSGPGPLPTDQAQVCLFAVQYAMAVALREYGVEPDAAVGHSVGELAVAAIAGVLSLPDAVALAVARGRACEELAPPGGMVAVSLPEPEATALAARFGCALAAVNSEGQCVLSGRSADVDVLVAGLTAERVPHTVLASTRPFHSPAMDAAGEALAEVVPGLALRPPGIRLVSSLTGAPAGDQIATAAYWRRQLVEPVRFAAALAAVGTPGTAYVDLGPGQVLRRLATACAAKAGGGFAAGLHPVRPEEADGGDLTRALARLWTAGAPVRWDRTPGPARRVRLPGHPFEPRRFPVPTGSRPAAPATPVPSGTTGPPRAAAPLPAQHDADSESTELVAAIFEEVVGAPVPDLELSFFDLGGDSLMAVQAAARISDAFGVRIGVAELTQHPSVRQLAARLVAAADG